jgi:hypothetical protein
MKMAKARQGQKWPAVLYLTSERWAPVVPVHVVDGEVLYRLLNAWLNAHITDATPVHLVKALDKKTAVYGRGDHPTTLYQVRRYRIPGGEFLYEWGPYKGQGDGNGHRKES